MVRAKLQTNALKQNRPFKIKHANTRTLDNIDSLKEKLEQFIEKTKDLDVQNKYNKFQELLYNKDKLENKTNKRDWVSNKTKKLLRNRADLISNLEKTKTIRNEIAK